MDLNKVLEQLMQNDYIDLNHINFYIRGKAKDYLSEIDQKRFLSLLEDKMLQLNIPFIDKIIAEIGRDFSPYSCIDGIQLVEENRAIIIFGKDTEGKNKHSLISERYNNSRSYESYMHDSMFYENPNFDSDEVPEKEQTRYENAKNKIYQQFAQLVNKAFRTANKKVRVEGSDGYCGILSIIDEVGALYVEGSPTDVVLRYATKEDFKLFTIIFIDSNNQVLRISAQIKNGQFIAEEETKFDNLLVKQSKKDNLTRWGRKKIEYYENGLNDLRKRPFELEKLKEFIWHISMPPYITQDEFHYQRPLYIAKEKLIQLLGISYIDASIYIQELNKSMRSYARNVQMGMEYSEYIPAQSLDDYLEGKNSKLLVLLRENGKSTNNQQ